MSIRETDPSNNDPVAQEQVEDNLNLSILGLGVAYPPHRHGPSSLDVLAERFYKSSPALTKVLSINRFTGIEQRASIGTIDHPIANQPTAPSIKELDELFREDGVRISVNACRNAIQEWGGPISSITHMVSTTCTNSANPGFDHYVRKQLGVSSGTENVLLHGIGCSGGLAAVRTACNLALGASFRKKPARVLVVACEISTPLFRSELDSVDKDQNVRIGVCLFSDGASACIVSNNIQNQPYEEESLYNVMGWKHETIANSETDLGFDVDPCGWKVVLTPQVPNLTCAVVAPAYQDLVQSIPSLQKSNQRLAPQDFDWALHPGGSTIITGVQRAMGLSEDHLRASYDIYMNYGNSSSATIMSVMKRLRSMGQGRDHVVACAFGPGISLEMMILQRGRGSGKGDTRNKLDGQNGHTAVNGHSDDHTHIHINGIDSVPLEDVD